MPELLEVKSNIGDLQKLFDELVATSLRQKEIIKQIQAYQVSLEFSPYTKRPESLGADIHHVAIENGAYLAASTI